MATQRKPGPPMRRIDEKRLEHVHDQNVNKLGPHDSFTDSTIAPKPEDAKRMATQDKPSPLH